jgi:hypothetical protein
MALENRTLPVETRLVARYKGYSYHCVVTSRGDDKVSFTLDCPDHPDLHGKEFKSPSSAGSAVMGGTACNGWRFWSLAGAEGETTAGAPKPKKKGKAKTTGEPEEAIGCGECAETFATPAEASEHFATAHPAADPAAEEPAE